METVEEFVKKRIDGCLSNKKIDNNTFYSRNLNSRQEMINCEGKVSQIPTSHFDTVKLGLENLPKLPKFQYTEASCGCFPSETKRGQDLIERDTEYAIATNYSKERNGINSIVQKSSPETPSEECIPEEENARDTSCYAFPRVRSISTNKRVERENNSSCGPKVNFDSK